ncbi:MAG: hypothetical protein WAZ75_00120 [Candidatus Absconditicoccaceae bacterium]
MTIPRVNTSGWFKTSTLTATELNQLDTNITYGIDKRNGETDVVSSDITVNSLGSITFESGATLNFDNPADLVLPDGYLSVDCILQGNTKPLRTGFIECPVGGLEDYEMGAAYYTNSIIKLTGELTIDLLITMPAIAGYSKIIDNACTSQVGGTYRVFMKTTTGALSKAVYLPNGKCCVVYCDGINIVLGPANTANNILSIQSKAETGSGFGVTQQAITHTSAAPEIVTTDTDYYFTFYNIQAGDQFDISYTTGLESTAGHFVAVNVVTTDYDNVLLETEFKSYGEAQRTTTMSSLYTAVFQATYVSFYLSAYCDGTTGYINSPLSFVVKHIRP